MNGNEFLDKFELIDNSFIQEAEICAMPKIKPWHKIAVTAACICLITVSVWAFLSFRDNTVAPAYNDSSAQSPADSSTPTQTENNETLESDSDTTSTDTLVLPLDPEDITTGIFKNYINIKIDKNTSNKFATLDRLIAYKEENISGNKDDGDATVGSDSISNSLSVDATALQVNEGGTLVAYGDYSYHLGENVIYISRLLGNSPANVGEIKLTEKTTYKSKLFICSNKLVAIEQWNKDGSAGKLENYSSVNIYDLATPENPMLVNEFIQMGQTAACYTVKDNIYLLTTDGQCACGAGHSNKESYVPHLTQNGRSVAWGDGDISILGEPSRICYLAAVKINVATGNIIDKQAFYGDIEEIFFGTDWLTVVVEEQNYTDAYTFNTANSFTHTGKVRLNDAVKENINFDITTITKANGIYRIVGTAYSAGKNARLLIITLDLSSQKGCVALMTPYSDEEKTLTIDDVVWEQNRAIVTVSTIVKPDYSHKANIILVHFSNLEVKIQDEKLSVDRVDGVDMIFAESVPFGLNPIISMGDGVYIRYNKIPNGLDIFNFNSSAPKLIYDSPGEIPTASRYNFVNRVYDKNTFGIIVQTPDSSGEYRNSTFSWNIYSVNIGSTKPYTLIKSVDIGKDNFLVSSLGFDTIKHNSTYYYATKNDAAVHKITW